MSQYQNQKDMLFDVRKDRLNLTIETVLDIFRSLKWVDVEWFTGDDAFLDSFIEVRLIRYICVEAGEIRKHDDAVRAGRAEAVDQVFDVTGFGLSTDRLNDLVYLRGAHKSHYRTSVIRCVTFLSGLPQIELTNIAI